METKDVKVVEHKWNYKAIVITILILVSLIVGIFLVVKLMYKKEVALTVSFETKSSIDIMLDENLKVIDVTEKPDFEDKITNDIKVKNVRLKTAVDEIVGKMIEKNYIDQKGDVILLRVFDGKNKKRLFEVERDVLRQIEGLVPKDYENINVFSFISMVDEDSVLKIAEENQVSLAKATLVDLILKKYVKKTKDELLNMKIPALTAILTDNEITSPKFISVECNADSRLTNIKDKEYISPEEAVNTSLEKLDIDYEDAYRISIRNEIEDNQPVYLIELIYSERKYSFVISAVTGVILDVDTKSAENFVEVPNAKDINFKELKKSVEKVIGVESAYLLALRYLDLEKTDAIMENVDFEMLGQVLVYSVTIDVKDEKTNVKIDAYNGNLIEENGTTKEDVVVEYAVEDSADALKIALDSEKLKMNEIQVKGVKYDEKFEKYDVVVKHDKTVYTFEVDKVTGEILSVKKTGEKSEDTLSKDEALEIAFKDIDIQKEDADVKSLFYDYNKEEYNIVFIYDKIEYSYKISGVDGKVNDLSKKLEEDEKGKEENIVISEVITKEAAFDFVVLGANLIKDNVKLERSKFDEEKKVYYMGIIVEGNIYNFEVDATNGNIIKTEYSPQKNLNGDKSTETTNSSTGKQQSVEPRKSEVPVEDIPDVVKVVLSDLGYTEDEVLIEKAYYVKANDSYEVILAAYDVHYRYSVDKKTNKVVDVVTE